MPARKPPPKHQPTSAGWRRCPGQQAPAPANIDATPTLAGESGGNIEATPITLQQKVKDNRGELQATQPGQVEVQENRRVRAK